jgi:hypothetical protein
VGVFWGEKSPNVNFNHLTIANENLFRLNGCVVLEKDADVLRSACIEWQGIRNQRSLKKAEDRSLQLWKRFVKGKFLLAKMKKRFNVE